MSIRPDLFHTLSDLGFLSETGTAPTATAAFAQPGVYRLQHATLLYRTETTGLLVDPHLHSDYETSVPRLTANFGCEDLAGRVDAILISHAHRDHWHLPSLLMFPRDIPIIVPRVPQISILSDDLEQCLRGFGFTNISSPDWYAAPVIIGDIEIHALPFYGEQPLRYDTPMHPNLRSWGNTYLIRTGFYSSWFLIDSGADSAGCMTDVARYVRDHFGKVDTILSNLRPFRPSTPFYITGSGSYWLSLSARQMRAFSSMERDCISLGTAGCAEVCQLAGARYFLPYANWWAEPGSPGPQEEMLMAEFRIALQNQQAVTEGISWSIGDGFIIRKETGFGLQPFRDQTHTNP